MKIKIIGYMDTKEVVLLLDQLKPYGITAEDLDFIPSHEKSEALLSILNTIWQIKFWAYYLMRYFP